MPLQRQRQVRGYADICTRCGDHVSYATFGEKQSFLGRRCVWRCLSVLISSAVTDTKKPSGGAGGGGGGGKKKKGGRK